MSWKRGEIWQVNPEKSVANELVGTVVGSEMKKIPRWVVVISSDAIITPLPVKITVPFTAWQESFTRNFWQIKIEPSNENGLTKSSSIDVLQTRGLDESRLITKKGDLPEVLLDEIILILNRLVESKLLL